MALESSAIPGDPTRAPSAPEAGTQSSGHTSGTLHWAVQLISCGLWKYGLIGVQPSVPQTPFGGEHEACLHFSFPLQVDQVDAPTDCLRRQRPQSSRKRHELSPATGVFSRALSVVPGRYHLTSSFSNYWYWSLPPEWRPFLQRRPSPRSTPCRSRG